MPDKCVHGMYQCGTTILYMSYIPKASPSNYIIIFLSCVHGKYPVMQYTTK
uniref:Uncharacterized protein n=1 Tax=Lepeophtheirus salmonis TaxID=72036 RepID=A0A0K2UYC6_LEPSM